MMSPVDWSFWLGLGLATVGSNLIVGGKSASQKNIGYLLGAVGSIMVVVASVEIVFQVHIQLRASWPWKSRLFFSLGVIAGGGVVGRTVFLLRERSLPGNLLDEAEAVEAFAANLKKANPDTAVGLLSLSKTTWRKIANDYYRQCGQRAGKLVRQSCDFNFKSNRKAIEYPDSYQDFFQIAVFLRTIELGLPRYRIRRMAKTIGGGMLVGVGLAALMIGFFVLD
jgi:hypothetical protein